MRKNESKSARGSRPEFIKKTAVAAAAVATVNMFKTPVYGQTQAPAPGSVVGANNRMLVGYIGVGNQGMAHVRSQKDKAANNNIVQAAVCDLSKTRVNDAKTYIGGDCQTYDDH